METKKLVAYAKRLLGKKELMIARSLFWLIPKGKQKLDDFIKNNGTKDIRVLFPAHDYLVVKIDKLTYTIY